MKVKDSKKKSKTDWEKLESMSDREIDYSDIPLLDENFFKRAKLKKPKAKSLISPRIDPDILAWFKAQGSGYQTRINAVLRMYMDAHMPNTHLNLRQKN